MDLLAVVCNRNYDILVPLITSMSDVIRVLQAIYDAVFDIVRCGRLIPLYTDTMYKAGCKGESSMGVEWLCFLCSLVSFSRYWLCCCYSVWFLIVRFRRICAKRGLLGILLLCVSRPFWNDHDHIALFHEDVSCELWHGIISKVETATRS